MKYFLTLLSDWRFSPQDFKHQLLARWPQATLQEQAPDEINSFEFDLVMTHSTLHGAIRRKGTTLPVEGDLRDVAEFALWVRTLVPAGERLHFCDEGVSGQLELEPGTATADIFRLFDYVPPPPGWMDYGLMTRPASRLLSWDFAQHLLQRWPSAHVEQHPDTHEHRILSFQVPMGHSVVSGSLKRHVPALVFLGDMRDCAEFALWCSSNLPGEEIPLFCDKGHLALRPTTTVEDVLQAFHFNSQETP